MTNLTIEDSLAHNLKPLKADNKVLTGSVIEAKKRGAIGVSAQVNLGSEFESEMIERMGEISKQAF